MTDPFSLARSTMAASLVLLAVGAAVVPGIVLAEEKAAPAAPPPVPAGPRKVRVIGADGTPESLERAPLTDVERYCTNIADPAKDARAAMQMQRLKELEAEVGRKVDELEAKRGEYQDWLQQRKAFIDSTSGIMIDIYAGMKPDAAAAQLAGLDRTTAASIVAKLKPRTASAILSEMPAPVAAELANLIVQKTNKDVGSVNAGAGQG